MCSVISEEDRLSVTANVRIMRNLAAERRQKLREERASDHCGFGLGQARAEGSPGGLGES